MADPSLHLVVIGGEEGESVIIRTPGGETGVVDVFAHDPFDPTSNPTLTWLEREGVQELAFLALTHPHLDHYQGASQLVERYGDRLRSLWTPPMGPADLEALKRAYDDVVRACPSPRQRRRYARGLRIWFDVQKHARHASRGDPRRWLTTVDTRSLYEERQHAFGITCLAPSTHVAYEYFRSMAPRPERGAAQGRLRVNHNRISSILGVRHGAWRGLLGGDAEGATWRELMGNPDLAGWRDARFIKVAHHGSSTSSFNTLWEWFNGALEQAALTCYRRQGLPDERGLSSILRHATSVHCSDSVSVAQAIDTDRTVHWLPWVEEEPAPRVGAVTVRVSSRGDMEVFHEGAALELRRSVS